ncbi:MAG: menaquinone biosynthesis protein, partial [Acidobacteria bacterium]|nr:menaquinone biosynthesis protein [Acidobacteriota bacterium]
IPSIEYLRGGPYRVVPDLAIASRGPVASVALFTTRPMADVRSIAVDTSSRTSIALVRVLCARVYKIAPAIEMRRPDLHGMLEQCDAALIIGDRALFLDPATVRLPPSPLSGFHLRHFRGSGGQVGATRKPDTTVDHVRLVSDIDQPGSGSVRLPPSREALADRRSLGGGGQPDLEKVHPDLEKIDLGEAWTALTGLPFVYAFWAGRPDALTAADVVVLQRARDEGVRHPEELARALFPDDPGRQAIGARYLRDNIKYVLGAEERAGLDTFYRYAAEAGLVETAAPLRFY